MKKIDFQKKIAQLYLEVEKVKISMKEKYMIEDFEKNSLIFMENNKNVKPFYDKEINNFIKNLKERKIELLENYKNYDVEEILTEKAKEYFNLTNEYMKIDPNFYDAFLIINPVWEKDYINLKNYIHSLKEKHPHVKLVKEKQYANIGTSTVYGSFEIATDMNTAFLISKEIEGNHTAQLQIHFLAIDPSFIPTFDKKAVEHSNSLITNNTNNYLETIVIASLTKSFLAPHENPVSIMKIFLNDEFANKINYHYIDSINGNKVTLKEVAKQFLENNS